MANLEKGKAALQDMADKWSQTLVDQLAWEEVVLPKTGGREGLAADIETCLNTTGYLNGLSLYDDVNTEWVKEVMNVSLLRIDKQKKRSNDLEGILFGSHHHLVGRSSAVSPSALRDTGGNLFTYYIDTAVFPAGVSATNANVKLWKARDQSAAGGMPSAGSIRGEINNGLDASSIFDNKHIYAYLEKLRDDASYDAGIPGREDLVQMILLHDRYFDKGQIFADMIKAMKSGGQKAISSFLRADPTNSDYLKDPPEDVNFAGAFLAALWYWDQYCTNAGFYDDALVQQEAQKVYQAVVDSLCANIPVDVAERKRNPVLGALSPLPPAPAFPITNITPFDFQCFLIENIVTLSSKHRNSKYKNLLRLNTNNNPGTAISRINHGGRSVQVRELMNLCPEAYALLTPYIKIYRVDYDKENPAKVIAQQELKIPNFIDTTDVDAILGAQGGRMQGYGIKSLKWSLDGVQPAEVDNNISAHLTFYFQTIQDLFQGQLAAGQKDASPLDLIISSAASEVVNQNNTDDSINSRPKNCSVLRDNVTQRYDGASFRIKATMGWSAPPKFATAFPGFLEYIKVGVDKSGKEIRRQRGEVLLDALQDTRISLFLQQTRHLINFKEDGSIELEIDYQAALSGILTSKRANILATDKKFFEQEMSTYQTKIDTLQNQADDGTEEAQAEKKEKIDELLAEIEQLKVQSRMFKYKKFLQKLYGSGKIYNIHVNAAELLIPPWKDLTDSQRASRARRRSSPNEAERGWLATGVNDNRTTFDTTLLEAVTEASKSGDEETAIEAQTKKNKEKFDKFSIDADTVTIPYFYLGDFLDEILEGLPGYADGDAFLFFLSEMELLNPLLAFQMSNLQEVLCSSNVNDAMFIDALRKSDPLRFGNINRIQEIINIGDVPISLDAFGVWFKDNVIEPGRDTYYVLHFVKDICAQLISNALRGDCFGSDVNFDMRFDVTPLTVKKQGLNAGTTVSLPTLAAKKAAAKGTVNPKKLLEAMVLYSTDSKPKSRTKDFDADLNDGIYHHYVGSACGLVKKIQLQREDQPYLREAKIQKRGALGAEQLRELYSVSIDLVGNTLYRNGQYIYVDPTYVMGDPKLARLLGVSGYYLVTSVEHSISDSGYDVNIRALQEGISFGDNTLATSPSLLDTDLEDTPLYVAPDIPPDEVAQQSMTAAEVAVAEAKSGFLNSDGHPHRTVLLNAPPGVVPGGVVTQTLLRVGFAAKDAVAGHRNRKEDLQAGEQALEDLREVD